MEQAEAAGSFECAVQEVFGDLFGDGFQSFHDHAFSRRLIPADLDLILWKEKDVDLSAYAFFQKCNFQLQDGRTVFVRGKFPGSSYQITFFMKGKPGFFGGSKSYRQLVPFSGFQEADCESIFFQGERNLLHTLGHIVVENLDKQWEKTDALWIKFKNLSI